MKIVIAGAGEVGGHLAKMLSSEDHDITVIDADPKRLENIASLADIVTVEGSSSSFAVLNRADVKRADLFIAVNPEESVNIISAVLAKELGARKSIARIDNDEYLKPNNKEVFITMGIDYLFYPEKVASNEIITLLGNTSSTEYVNFSGGKLTLVVFKLDESSVVVGKSLTEATPAKGVLDYRTVAISREGETIIPRGSDVFQANDMVYVISDRAAVPEVLAYSGRASIQVNDMMILGGSQIGRLVAQALENQVNIKMVDYDAVKARRLAETLKNTLVINQDGRNADVMAEEELGKMDAFVAVTGRSETNILAAMLAKRMGVKKVIAEVENLTYIGLAESMGVDTVINKKLIMASNIFRFTMNTDVQAIKCLTGCEAEVLEFIAKPNSLATRNKIRDLEFPDDATIGGIVRGERVFIARGDTEIKAYDRVVVFALPKAISKIGRFFV